MSAGTVIDRELTQLHGICGRIGLMVVKRRLIRPDLLAMADQLERIAKAIRAAVSP